MALPAWVIWVFVGSLAASYYAAKKAQRMAKKAADDMAGVLFTKESTIEPIPVIYGERRVGGTRVFIETKPYFGGDKHNKELYMAIVLGEGEVTSITDIHIDDKPLSSYAQYLGTLIVDTGTVIVGGQDEELRIEKFYGTDGQAASTMLQEAPSWTSNHKLSGLAYLAIRLRWNDEAYMGIPDVSAVVKGKKIYDPRKDSTSAYYDVSLGVSTHRLNDTTTWQFSDNAALCLRDYMTNTRYGKGLPESAIDYAAFVQAADDLDSFTVTPYVGAPSPIPLFQLNAVIDTGDEIFKNVERILMACRGFLPYRDGKYGLTIDQASSSALTITADMIIGGVNIVGEKKEDKFNRIEVKYPNPRMDFRPDTVVWPEPGSAEETSYLAEDGGTLLKDEVDLEFTTNYYQARDLARIFLLRSRNALACGIKCTSEAMDLVVGDVVTVEHPTPGWPIGSGKLFQIQNMTLNYDGTVDLNLLEYDGTIYAYDSSAEERSYPDSVLPDPFLVEPVTSLTATPGVEITESGQLRPYIEITWTDANDALVSKYLVQWTYNNNSYSIETYQTRYRLYTDVATYTYDISVRSINSLGVKSAAAVVNGVQPVIDTTPPADPGFVSITGELNRIHLVWTNPSDSDFSHIEINRGATAVLNDSALLATTAATEFVDGEFNGVTTFHYWVRALDTTGNASAWVYMGSATSRLLIAEDYQDGVIALEYLETDVQSILNNAVSTATYNAGITTLTESVALKADAIDVNVIIGDVSDTRYDAIDLAENVLKNALDTHRNAKTMSDAGISVNPNDGTVYIYALDVYKGVTDSRLGSAEIRLDGAESTINLKAEYTYVDQKIAEANFDPSQVADLTDLFIRVGQAEVDIDAAEANINLKADLTLLNDPTTGVIARVTQAEIDIDAVEGQISLKVDTSDFDTLESRVGTAEITLNSIDAPSIAQTVTDVLFLSDEQIDLANTSLEGLLAFYKDRKETMAALARARQMLTADVIDARNVSAEYRLELLAKTDANEASIISESLARIAEDESLASQITTLNATTAANTASIIATDAVVTTNTTAIAENKIEIDARLDTAEGNITQINTVNLSSTSAIAQSVAQLQIDVGEGGLAGQIQDIQDIISGEGSIRANDITTLAVTQGYKITDLEEKTFDDILRGYEDRKTLQAALAIARQSLTADINDSREAFASYRLELAAAIDDNVARITQEAFTRATEDSALAQTISELSVEVGNNAAAITTEQVTRATETSANASAITTLQATVNDPVSGVAKSAADIVQINNVSATSGSAIAKAVHGVTSTYDGFTSTITTTAQSVDGIKNQYSVTIDNNGYLTGYGLISDIIDGNPTSAFRVQADQFSVAKDAVSDSPFVVYTTDTVVNKNGQSVTIPAGVYIDDAFIQDAAISNAKIGNIIESAGYSESTAGWRLEKDGTFTVRGTGGAIVMQVSGGSPSYDSSIANSSVTLSTLGFTGETDADNTASNPQAPSWLTTGALNTGVEIKSTNYSAGTAGWSIKADGTAEFQQVTVRGTLNATDLTAGTLNVDRISSNAIDTVKIAYDAISSSNTFYQTFAIVNGVQKKMDGTLVDLPPKSRLVIFGAAQLFGAFGGDEDATWIGGFDTNDVETSVTGFFQPILASITNSTFTQTANNVQGNIINNSSTTTYTVTPWVKVTTGGITSPQCVLTYAYIILRR